MPIYEYRCASCGHEVEALQKLSDALLTVCPACHKAELKKRVSAAGFQLKGSGWYVTDFRNKAARPSAKDQAATSEGAAKGNGNATAAGASDAPSVNAGKPETKTMEKAAASGEAKPVATTSSTKSDN